MAMVAAVPPAWAPKRAALPVPEAEDARGDEGGPTPTGRPGGGERLGALGPRTPWVERVDALRQKLRCSSRACRAAR